MNLKQIRTAFVQRSGRYDLVVDSTDWVDNGANFYINAGQRFLDRMDTHQKSVGRVFKQVVSGRNHITFPYCRAIQQVWCMDGESRTKLAKKDLSDIRQVFVQPLQSLDSGEPLFYAPALLRLVPETDRLTIAELDSVMGFTDVTVGQHYEYNGIIFMPPADGTYVIEVWGLFYSPSLDSDTEESYWSVVHPEVLLMAALRQLEVTYRNTEGANDWLNAIQLEVAGIGKDFVEEESAEVDQMEG